MFCDLFNLIINKYLDNITIYNISKINVTFYNNIEIHTLDDTLQVDDNVLKLRIFSYLRKIDVRDRNITNINHLKYLEEINMNLDSFISTPKISNGMISSAVVKHHTSNLKPEGFSQLTNIKILEIRDNKEITDIENFPNLIKLNLSGKCGVNQEKLECLMFPDKIIEINAFNNKTISDLSIFSNLRVLHAGGICNVDQQSISKIKNLKELYIQHNRNITDVNHLKDLVILDISACYVDQKGISNLTKLEVLNITNNFCVTDVNHLTCLKKLDASGLACGLNQNGLISNISIVELNLSDNLNVYDVNHLINLESLDISNRCNVTPNGISKLNIGSMWNLNYDHNKYFKYHDRYDQEDYY